MARLRLEQDSRLATVVWLVALTVLSPFLVGCGLAGSSASGTCSENAIKLHKIHNGSPGDKAAYGYVVRLDITATTTRALCSGVLISKSAVLSAAHCFSSSTIGTVLSAKATTSGATVETAPGIGYRTSPTYDPKNFDSPDLSIIYLDHNLAQSPVTFASSNAAIGTAVTAIGYGLDGCGSDGDGTLGRFLQGALEIIDSKDSQFGCGTSKNICAHASTAADQETCEGDSGSPLMNGQNMIGILSSGDTNAADPTCRGSLNSVYTSTVDQNAWIQAQLTAGSAGSTPLTH